MPSRKPSKGDYLHGSGNEDFEIWKTSTLLSALANKLSGKDDAQIAHAINRCKGRAYDIALEIYKTYRPSTFDEFCDTLRFKLEPDDPIIKAYQVCMTIELSSAESIEDFKRRFMERMQRLSLSIEEQRLKKMSLFSEDDVLWLIGQGQLLDNEFDRKLFKKKNHEGEEYKSELYDKFRVLKKEERNKKLSMILLTLNLLVRYQISVQ